LSPAPIPPENRDGGIRDTGPRELFQDISAAHQEILKYLRQHPEEPGEEIDVDGVNIYTYLQKKLAAAETLVDPYHKEVLQGELPDYEHTVRELAEIKSDLAIVFEELTGNTVEVAVPVPERHPVKAAFPEKAPQEHSEALQSLLTEALPAARAAMLQALSQWRGERSDKTSPPPDISLREGRFSHGPLRRGEQAIFRKALRDLNEELRQALEARQAELDRMREERKQRQGATQSEKRQGKSEKGDDQAAGTRTTPAPEPTIDSPRIAKVIPIRREERGGKTDDPGVARGVWENLSPERRAKILDVLVVGTEAFIKRYRERLTESIRSRPARESITIQECDRILGEQLQRLLGPALSSAEKDSIIETVRARALKNV
jgi:hypothetical protein